MSSGFFTTYVELEIEVDADVSPPSRGARDRYGLQLEPDDPGDIELNTVKIGGLVVDPKLIKVGKRTLADLLIEEARTEAAEDDASAADDAADRRRDEMMEA